MLFVCCLVLQVLFDPGMINAAPDFIFDDDTFFPLHPRGLEEVCHNAVKQSLLNWDAGNNKSLKMVVDALLQGIRSAIICLYIARAYFRTPNVSEVRFWFAGHSTAVL